MSISYAILGIQKVGENKKRSHGENNFVNARHKKWNEFDEITKFIATVKLTLFTVQILITIYCPINFGYRYSPLLTCRPSGLVCRPCQQ
jgi:hypothetical protein